MPLRPRRVQGDLDPDSFDTMKQLFERGRRIWSSRRFRRTVVFVLLGGGVFALTVGVGAWTRACANDACPSIQGLTGYDPDQASIVYAADGRPITDFGLTRRTVIPIREMAPAMPAAFVAVEDKRFYQHHGVDWIRFFGVIKHTLLHGNLQQGFSTITMQLAGNILPSSRSTASNGASRAFPGRSARCGSRWRSRRTSPRRRSSSCTSTRSTSATAPTGSRRRRSATSASRPTTSTSPRPPCSPRCPRGPSATTRAATRRSPWCAATYVIDLLRDDGRITAEDAERWKAYPMLLSSRKRLQRRRRATSSSTSASSWRPASATTSTRDGLRIYTTLDLDAQLAAERALDDQLEQDREWRDGALQPTRPTASTRRTRRGRRRRARRRPTCRAPPW